MSKGFGAIITAGVAGSVLWAFGQYRRSPADAEEQYVIIPAASGGGDDRQRNALLGIIDLLGKEVGSTRSQAVTVATPAAPRVQSASRGMPALKALIQSKEGGIGGYNTIYGGSKIRPPKNLTKMTVREVRDYQQRSVNAGSKSSAMGAYQIIRKTLDACVSAGAVKWTDKFDAAAQERCGDYLMRLRGLNKYMAGTMTATKFAQELSREWASLPCTIRDARGRAATGQSYYAGDGLNKAHHTIAQLMNAVKGLK